MNICRYLNIGLFLFCFTVLGQEKFEREYRINSEEIPESAINFIERCRFNNTVRWYVEESQDGKTYEAKTKHKGNKLSLEFSPSGNIIDIETKVELKDIREKIRENILEKLSKKFTKYKIRKIQAQHSNDDGNLIELIKKKDFFKNASKYEIVLKGKIKKEKALFEILIDSSGTILKELRFVARDEVNMEF